MKLSVRTKLFGTAGVLLAFMAGLGLVALTSLGSVNDNSELAYTGGTLPIEQLAVVKSAVLDRARLASYGIVEIAKADVQAAIDTEVAADSKAILDNLAAYEKTGLSEAETATLADFRTANAQYAPIYAQMRTDTKAGNAAAATAGVEAMLTTRATLMDDAQKLLDFNDAQAKTLNDATQSTFDSSRVLMVVFLLIATILGLALAFILARSIMTGLLAVQSTLTSMADRCATSLEGGLGALARNDLSVPAIAVTKPIEHFGSDEIGQTAAVTNTMLARLQATIASYETARAGLAATISEVKAAADAVGRTSGELDGAATQSGSASTQIASTISQVAAGAADQARAASETSSAVADLGSVISQVGAGAAAAAASVGESLGAVGRMQAAIAAEQRLGAGRPPPSQQNARRQRAGGQDPVGLGKPSRVPGHAGGIASPRPR